MKRGVIDIGNSRIKTAVFSPLGEPTEKATMNSLQEAINWQQMQGSESVILASVKQETAIPETPFALHTLNSSSQLPFTNAYKTPETLGADRIAAMAAASTLYNGQAVLVFDIGTCMTIDLLHPGNIFKGGNISPGIDLRLKALHHYTGRLPLVPSETPHEAFGTDTATAIAAGVINGMRNEIESYIRHTEYTYPDLITILCGGNQNRFDLSDKFKIFAAPDFVLQGLYHLLILNEH